MPQYKLTYFWYRARAEVSRMLFRLAGEEFEDVVIQSKDWPGLKPKAPFGQLPLLEEDGKVICQSSAINRYLAKKFGYAGKTDWEQAQVDMVVGCLDDFHKLGFHVHYEKDENVKEKLLKRYLDQIPIFMEYFEKMLANNPTGYFVGNQMTWADLSFAEMVLWPDPLVGIKVDLANYPKCKELQTKIHSHPIIAAYLSDRWPERKAD